MKKNGFVEGAMIATTGIVISRIIGLIYVIPFYSLIGSQGGALYSYAYSIYAIFLSLSSNSIPIAISKMISEYNAMGYYHTKERVYKVGSQLIIAMSFIFFIVLMLFSKEIAFLIIGDIKGGNTIEGIESVIRVVATALLIVPFLSVVRGYLQGHKYMAPSSISNVVEQIFRVAVLLGGSYMVIKVFKLSIATGVGVAVFGATIGALAAYLYLISKINKNREALKRDVAASENEKGITTKEIARKIVLYALPFIIIDLARSSIGMIDTLTVVRTLTNLGYNIQQTEASLGIISTWASKINMIVIAIVLGLDISLIPNLAGSFIKKDWPDVSNKINQSIRIIIFTALPMAIGLSFLAQPVWVIFYGYDPFSISLFRLYVFQTITYSLFYILIDIMQTMNNTKVALGALLLGFITKLVINIPIMYLLHYLNIPAYYGPIVANLIFQTLIIIIIMYVLHKYYKIHYQNSGMVLLKTVMTTAIMLGALLVMNMFFEVNAEGRLMALIQTSVYAVVGAAIYIFISYKSGLLFEVLGKNSVNTILIKLKLKKN